MGEHNAENDAPKFKPPVDLADLAIPDLTDQERDDFMAALTDDTRITPPGSGDTDGE